MIAEYAAPDGWRISGHGDGKTTVYDTAVVTTIVLVPDGTVDGLPPRRELWLGAGSWIDNETTTVG